MEGTMATNILLILFCVLLTADGQKYEGKKNISLILLSKIKKTKQKNMV